MKAVIVAGGIGSRIIEITNNVIPKSLVEFDGMPLIFWQISQLKKNGIEDIIVIVGYLGDAIVSKLGNGEILGVKVEYYYEENPLGTGGALLFLEDKLKDTFVFLYGDIVFDVDILRMNKYHITNKSVITSLVHVSSHLNDSDLVELSNSNRINRIILKSEANDFFSAMGNSGIYIVEPIIFEICKKLKGKLDFEKDILTKLIEEKSNVFAYKSTEYVKDIGTRERYYEAIADCNNKLISKKNFSNKQKCIFLDRDGTVNVFKGYITDFRQIEIEKRVVEAIKKIKKEGFLCIIITNQPVVARGMCDETEVKVINNYIQFLLAQEKSLIDDIFFCPHHPDKGFEGEKRKYKKKCDCRKPEIGLIMKASKHYNIDLSNSWMIGDSTVDVKTGENANMNTVMLRTGIGGEDRRYDVQPNIVANNLAEAIDFIIKYKKENVI